MSTDSPAAVTTTRAPLSLVPRPLTSAESGWLSLAACVSGLLAWLFVDSYAVAFLIGGVFRTAMPLVIGNSGEARKVAIVINLLIYGGLLGTLGLVYNYGRIAEALGAG